MEKRVVRQFSHYPYKFEISIQSIGEKMLLSIALLMLVKLMDVTV
jgi:hypothetical protein